MKNTVMCYIKNNDKTLMLYRNKKVNDVHKGKYVGLGGKIECGESPEEAIVREVWEESGLLVKNPVLRGIITFPNFKDDEDWLMFLFIANDFTGEIIDSYEGTLEWIDDDKILNLSMWKGDLEFFKWLQDGRMFSGKIVYENSELIDFKVNFY